MSRAAQILIILLLALLLLGYPGLGLHNFGYYPMGGLGTVLLIVLVCVVIGVL